MTIPMPPGVTEQWEEPTRNTGTGAGSTAFGGYTADVSLGDGVDFLKIFLIFFSTFPLLFTNSPGMGPMANF